MLGLFCTYFVLYHIDGCIYVLEGLWIFPYKVDNEQHAKEQQDIL